MESGASVRGAEVLALPSGRATVVKDIVCLDSSLPVAVAGDSVTLTLADDIDISRGDMLADPTRPARAAKAIEARICWLSTQPLAAPALPAARFVLKHTTRSVKAKLVSLNSRVDVDTLERQRKAPALASNDVPHPAPALPPPPLAAHAAGQPPPAQGKDGFEEAPPEDRAPRPGPQEGGSPHPAAALPATLSSSRPAQAGASARTIGRRACSQPTPQSSTWARGSPGKSARN